MRMIRYILRNQDKRSLNKPLSFYFVGQRNDQTFEIDEEGVLDITWKTTSQHSVVSLVKRTDEPGIGPGFTVLSGLPGNSEFQVSLVLDIDSHPELANAPIVIGKKAGVAILKEQARQPRTYALTFTTVLMTVLASAVVAIVVFGFLWMFINLRFGNYTVGARMWDWLFDRLRLGHPLRRFIFNDKRGNVSRK